MIKRIKIYGERNSGTRFVKQLIMKNILNVKTCDGGYEKAYGWKHGIPKLNLFDNMIDDTLFIFIIRDLESWLKSMYTKPYSLKKSVNIQSFLTNKIESSDHRSDHDVNIYEKERNKTIFELRYCKIQSYIDTFNNIKNGIIVNLEDLQLDDGKEFINIINNKFKCSITQKFIPITKHTKTNKVIKNRDINININKNIIDRQKDKDFEDFVKGLKKKYQIKLMF
jgi:hypothetical protein